MRNDDFARPATPAPMSRRSVAAFWLLWLLWLPLFIPSLLALFQSRPGPLRLALSLAGAALFFALYLRVTWGNAHRLASPIPLARPMGLVLWAPVLAMIVLSLVLAGANGEPWGALFIYTSASASGRLPTAQALRVLGVLLLLTLVGAGFLQLYSRDELISALVFIAIPGLCVIGFHYSVTNNQRLRVAHEEMARQAAVTDERLRIARDLHDLLGHNLSVIALKSELARRLVAVDPQRAATEIGDIESVARTALQEVREAVAGYRQPSLAGELAGAREVLAAAGIASRVEGEASAGLGLPPATDTALAWAVREGVTNMLRHSHARSCAIRVARLPAEVSIELTNDGMASDAPSGAATPGNGLRGLAERVEALGGRSEAGPCGGGDFCLRVWLPLAWDDARIEAAPSVPVNSLAAPDRLATEGQR